MNTRERDDAHKQKENVIFISGKKNKSQNNKEIGTKNYTSYENEDKNMGKHQKIRQHNK